MWHMDFGWRDKNCGHRGWKDSTTWFWHTWQWHVQSQEVAGGESRKGQMQEVFGVTLQKTWILVFLDIHRTASHTCHGFWSQGHPSYPQVPSTGVQGVLSNSREHTAAPHWLGPSQPTPVTPFWKANMPPGNYAGCLGFYFISMWITKNTH